MTHNVSESIIDSLTDVKMPHYAPLAQVSGSIDLNSHYRGYFSFKEFEISGFYTFLRNERNIKMGDIGKYIVIGGAVLIVAVIFLVIIRTRNGFVVPVSYTHLPHESIKKGGADYETDRRTVGCKTDFISD